MNDLLKYGVIVFGAFASFFAVRKVIISRMPDPEDPKIEAWRAVRESVVMRHLRHCLLDKPWLSFKKEVLFKTRSENFQTKFSIFKNGVQIGALAVSWNSLRDEKLSAQIGKVILHSTLEDNDVRSFFHEYNRLLRRSRFMKTA